MTRQKKNLKGRGAAGYVVKREDVDGVMESLRRNVAREAAPTEDSEEKPKRPAVDRVKPGDADGHLARLKGKR